MRVHRKQDLLLAVDIQEIQFWGGSRMACSSFFVSFQNWLQCHNPVSSSYVFGGLSHHPIQRDILEKSFDSIEHLNQMRMLCLLFLLSGSSDRRLIARYGKRID